MATATHNGRTGRPSSHARHEALQQLLAREQHALRTRMGALRESASGEMTATTDVEERSGELVDFGVGLAALGLCARTVQSLEIAMRRLDAGTYGTCLDCRSRIEAARLRAVPFAVLCRGCQEQQEAFGADAWSVSEGLFANARGTDDEARRGQSAIALPAGGAVASDRSWRRSLSLS